MSRCEAFPVLRYLSPHHTFLQPERPYDLVVLCGMDFSFVQDGTRQQPAFRERQHDWYLHELNQRGIDFLEVIGTVPQRNEQVCRRLAYGRGGPLPEK